MDYAQKGDTRFYKDDPFKAHFKTFYLNEVFCFFFILKTWQKFDNGQEFQAFMDVILTLLFQAQYVL